ncbi:hypothetical protein NBO_383g0001 [Nosema bombycis CQ1]|uniref:Uncharacterized protein n=1 Tax=Nosema bombycis (strain CQ1 / CVCC 102059) TaxID=578461 RepID=R0KPP4_NOSB1|nr:hypothetical protein NBO_383g0001 [Nosema bombycis CQ1]|eukprot:EOB12676.1 hypothetical protein NBO_383g0001 [Nosema bombycis CQ1]
MKFKGNLKTKRAQKITSKEPTNIFDFNRPSKVIDFNKLIKITPTPSKPLKVIDFNKMILTQTKSNSLEINEIKKPVKNPVKRKKMMKVKFVNFDEMILKEKNKEEGVVKVDDLKDVKDIKEVKDFKGKVEDVKGKLEEVKKVGFKQEIQALPTQTISSQPLPTQPLTVQPLTSLPLPTQPVPIKSTPLVNHRNFVNRVLSSLEDGSTITDLIKIYIKEKKKTSKSLYLHNLGEKIDNNLILIEDIDLNKEIERLDKQIENIEIQDKLWKKIREASFRDNTFYIKNNENNQNYDQKINKEEIDLKIKEKINKLKFIKESLNLNIKKVKSKVQEEEEKIFN